MAIEQIQNVLNLFKDKASCVALTAFIVEMAIILTTIKTKKIKQEKENKDRISLALENYALK